MDMYTYPCIIVLYPRYHVLATLSSVDSTFVSVATMSFSQAFHHMLASSLLLVVLSSALVAAGPVYYENALKSQLTFAAALDRVSIKVPVTLGVMSRCPDALFCEEVFDSVVEEVGFDKVDVTLSFIAKSVELLSRHV